jgi:hypothetical protein
MCICFVGDCCGNLQSLYVRAMIMEHPSISSWDKVLILMLMISMAQVLVSAMILLVSARGKAYTYKSKLFIMSFILHVSTHNKNGE